MTKEKNNATDVPRCLKVEWNGTTYEMGFDRESALLTERTYGVSMSDVVSMQLNALMGLYYGSFLKRHPKMRQEVKDALFDNLSQKMELLMQLAAMYSEQVETLLADPDEGNALSWTAV